MSVDVAASFLPPFFGRARKWGGRLGRSGGAAGDSSSHRDFLTQEQFQEELVVLGLSDLTFGPEEYARALGTHLGLEVRIDVVPDTTHPLLSRELARKGVTGEVLYRADLAKARVIVPGSLPPLALIFTLLHELGHLAAGDLFVYANDSIPSAGSAGYPTLELPRENRLAQSAPFAHVEHREREADLRAGYAFVAGCLGDENPYAQRMYNIL